MCKWHKPERSDYTSSYIGMGFLGVGEGVLSYMKSVQRSRLLFCALAVVVISVSVMLIPALGQQTGAAGTQASFNSGSLNLQYPSGLLTYYVGPTSFATFLTSVGAPVSAIQQVSISDLNYLPNESNLVVNNQAVETNLLTVNTTAHLFGKGDLLMIYDPTGVNATSMEYFLGAAWATEFHSNIMGLLPVEPSPSGNLIAANGVAGLLKINNLPLSNGLGKINFLLRIHSWQSLMRGLVAQASVSVASPSSTTDEVTYLDNNLPSGTVMLLTGQTVGNNNQYGEYIYDIGVWSENTLVAYGSSLPGVYEIPVTTMGWIKFTPSSTLTNVGSINSLSSNINYMSSYQAYPGTENSYLYDIQSVSPDQSTGSGSTSYTLGVHLEGIFPSPYFQVTYTPPSSTLVVQYSDYSYTGVPQSEDLYGWSFSYGQTIANGAYADGYSAQGDWLLTAGSSNFNDANISMNQQVQLVIGASPGPCCSVYYQIETITLNGSFFLYYSPSGSSFSTSGSYCAPNGAIVTTCCVDN